MIYINGYILFIMVSLFISLFILKLYRHAEVQLYNLPKIHKAYTFF